MKATELRGARKNAGIRTQGELAKETGLSTETIADIELGKLGIDEETNEMLLSTIEKIRQGRLSNELVPAS